MGHVGSHLAAGQFLAERRHKEETADNKDQRNGRHADQVLDRIFVADDHMPGNGVEQHFQHTAGAVLCQHLDKLNADDDIQRAGQEFIHFHLVAVHNQTGHPLDQRHNAEQQPHQNNAGEYHLQQTGRLGNLIAEDSFDTFLLAVQGRIGQTYFLFVHHSDSSLWAKFFILYHIFCCSATQNFALFLRHLIKSYLCIPNPIKNDKNSLGKLFSCRFLAEKTAPILLF